MLRLRKGFGSVRKLTGNRRNCYAVHPPTVKGVRPKALCYTDDYNIGVCVLNAWHNGKYYSGMELDLKERKLDEVVSTGSCTFQGVYEIYWNHKFGESAAKELSKSSRNGMHSAWLKLENIWQRGGEGVLEMYYGQGSRSDQKTVQVCDTERTLPKRDGNLRGDAEGKGRGASCGFY